MLNAKIFEVQKFVKFELIEGLVVWGTKIIDF